MMDEWGIEERDVFATQARRRLGYQTRPPAEGLGGPGKEGREVGMKLLNACFVEFRRPWSPMTEKRDCGKYWDDCRTG